MLNETFFPGILLWASYLNTLLVDLGFREATENVQSSTLPCFEFEPDMGRSQLF